MRPFLLFAIALAALSAAPGAARAEARNPDGVAVIIGNKTYRNFDIPEVKFADRDAQAVKSYVIDVLGYDEKNIIYLENATQGAMLDVFGSADEPAGKLAHWLRPGGTSDVLVYYSGHGVPGIRDAQGYLLPVDADPDAVTRNGYPLSLLYTNLEMLGAHSVTVLLDACFSGASAGGALLRNASVMTRPANPAPIGAAGGLTLIAAAQADQLANWDDAHRHGLFTEYFLEAVYGRANEAKYGGHGDGRITLAAVQKYLDAEMSYAARREDGREQDATVSGDPGFVLASLAPDAPPLRHDEDAAAPAFAIDRDCKPDPVAGEPGVCEAFRRCDRLAGDPLDPARRASGWQGGVSHLQLRSQLDEAERACRAVLPDAPGSRPQPTSERAAYALFRIAYQRGQMERAFDYAAWAAAAGYKLATLQLAERDLFAPNGKSAPVAGGARTALQALADAPDPPPAALLDLAELAACGVAGPPDPAEALRLAQRANDAVAKFPWARAQIDYFAARLGQIRAWTDRDRDEVCSGYPHTSPPADATLGKPSGPPT